MTCSIPTTNQFNPAGPPQSRDVSELFEHPHQVHHDDGSQRSLKTNRKRPRAKQIKNTARSLCNRKPRTLHWEADPPEGAAQRRTRWPPPREEPPGTTAALRSVQHHRHECNQGYAKIAVTVQTSGSSRSVKLVVLLYLSFTTGALLHQAPRHGAGDGKCLEERADEVTQTQRNQFLKPR